MSEAIRPREGIEAIHLYKGGESRIVGRDDVLKLSSNENPQGAPKAARQAFAEAAADLHRYPPTDHAELRSAIAGVHRLDPQRIICGAGSDEIITFLCMAYGGPGTEVIHTEHGFLMYRITALATGATPVEVPERERTVDPGAILAAVTPKTRLVFIANPANPTGTMISPEEAAILAEALPPHVLLVLDGAYAEFAEGYDGGAALATTRPNVVMTRTFSKLYGLGGLRVGWGYGPQEVIDNLNRVRGPFNLGNAQLRAAEAAVLDRTWAERCMRDNARLRDRLTGALRQLGLGVDESHANFVLVRFEDEAAAHRAEAALRQDGILVRATAGYKLPQALRITIGTDSDIERVIASLQRFMGAS